jgi:hypothetical protein
LAKILIEIEAAEVKFSVAEDAHNVRIGAFCTQEKSAKRKRNQRLASPDASKIAYQRVAGRKLFGGLASRSEFLTIFAFLKTKKTLSLLVHRAVMHEM